MLREVWIVANYNLYESKRYFCAKLVEAFQRRGVIARVIDVEKDNPYEWMVKNPQMQPPDFWCSFNRTEADKNGQYYWDRKKVPFLSFLIDPAIYDMGLTRSPYSILSCVDRKDCALLQESNFHRVLFLPHAVERDLAPPQQASRPYDVVFLGSCYDPEGLRAYWQEKYPKEQVEVFDEAAEWTLADRTMPFWKAVPLTLQLKGIELAPKLQERLIRAVDNYVRGVDREQLIRSIKGVHVHLFGATCWREEKPIRGWMQSLGDLPNVTIHPAIPFRECLAVLKQSKICLNSMPFFKDGSHERILTGLACGSLPITTDSVWVTGNFCEGEELVTYSPKKWDEINDKVHAYLSNEKQRQEVVSRGREKVMREHTWDNRVEQLIKEVPPFLEKMVHNA